MPARFDPRRPLIGIVGEIFCRLNNFSNQDLVRRLEDQGAECWMADIAEWIAYTNVEEVRNLRLAGRTYSWEMLKSKLRSRIQHADEHALRSLFVEDFAGYEEPGSRRCWSWRGRIFLFPGPKARWSRTWAGAPILLCTARTGLWTSVRLPA